MQSLENRYKNSIVARLFNIFKFCSVLKSSSLSKLFRRELFKTDREIQINSASSLGLGHFRCSFATRRFLFTCVIQAQSASLDWGRYLQRCLEISYFQVYTSEPHCLHLALVAVGRRRKFPPNPPPLKLMDGRPRCRCRGEPAVGSTGWGIPPIIFIIVKRNTSHVAMLLFLNSEPAALTSLYKTFLVEVYLHTRPTCVRSHLVNVSPVLTPHTPQGKFLSLSQPSGILSAFIHIV